MKNTDRMKIQAKKYLSIEKDFDVGEILMLMLLKDQEGLQKVIDRAKVLRDAYNKLCTELDSGDNERIQIAIAGFTRPKID